VSKNLKFTPIPALRDNYIWLISNSSSSSVYVVDPGEAQVVLDYLQENTLDLAGILVTHSHRDHIGGINDITLHHKVPVYGPSTERIPQVNIPVSEGSAVELWTGVSFRVMEVPGHMDEHIVYFFEGDAINPPALCSGDTLFSSGCGRMFMGPAPTYKHSLDRLKQLPRETVVYCTHEYTEANLKFAAAIEPENKAIREKQLATTERIATSGCSLPTNIASERETNPFLRCDQQTVIDSVRRMSEQELENEVEIFAALRSLKDQF